VGNEYKGQPKDGKLADIAPTILALMGIAQPADMTGVSLL
jgi:2,3-bisphosphoglycerate-independent phosphoglycerate mutase